ncbi:hypothetical protein ACWC9S_27190 [Streptomyces xiamenensis]
MTIPTADFARMPDTAIQDWLREQHDDPAVTDAEYEAAARAVNQAILGDDYRS